jgi:acyl-CoA synthetase (AMP-forming)/AMP-acid ligase II
VYSRVLVGRGDAAPPLFMDDLPKTATGKILKRELTGSGRAGSDATAPALGAQDHDDKQVVQGVQYVRSP